MKIVVMRHGLTDYKQNYPVSIEDADDLQARGIPKIKSSALKMNGCFNHQPNIVSSPYGRTIHTAKIVADVLTIPHHYIVLNHELEEVRNFDFELLRVLTQGGIYRFKDESITINSRYTNPNYLPHTTYFNSDLTRQLPVSAKKRLPQELVEKIERMETCTEACQRLENVLQTLDKDSLVVTHQGLTQRLLEKMGYTHKQYVDRGEFIIVEASNRILKPLCWSEKY